MQLNTSRTLSPQGRRTRTLTALRRGVDTPLADWRVTALRQQFALVSQDVVLFNDSVAANVALGTGTGIYRGEGNPLNLPRFGVSQRTARNPELLSLRIFRGARS